MDRYMYQLEMFDDELYISYLSRIYARFGFIEPIAFNKTVFCNPRKNVNLNFVNPINDGLLSISKETLVRHSLFNFQVLFNPEAKRIWKSILNSDGKYQRLDIGITTKNEHYRLKYCPECAREQKERYLKVVDQIIPVCLIHRCFLVDSTVVVNSKTTFRYESFLEISINDKATKCEYSQRQIDYYSYIANIAKLAKCGININARQSISDYLINMLIAKGYSNLRQDRLKIIRLYRECEQFYSFFADFKFVSLSSFKAVFKNLTYSIFTIAIIGFFLEITPEELFLRKMKNRIFHNEVKIKKMYFKGQSQEQLSKKYNCSRQNISKIILGKH